MKKIVLNIDVYSLLSTISMTVVTRRRYRYSFNEKGYLQRTGVYEKGLLRS